MPILTRRRRLPRSQVRMTFHEKQARSRRLVLSLSRRHFALFDLQVRALRRKYDVTFLRLAGSTGFPVSCQTQFDYSASTLVEPNERIIDTMNPLTWCGSTPAQPCAAGIDCLPVVASVFRSAVWQHRATPEGPLRSRVCFLCHNVMPHEGSGCRPS